jgi:sec-independent protein translocase protein TatA
MDLGPAELLIILAVVLVLFGGAKLPQLARSLGAAKREFEEGARVREAAPPATPPAADTATDTTADAPPGTA